MKTKKKTYGGTVYRQILITAKLQTGEAKKTELTGRSPLRRGRCALDCSVIEELEEEKEEEEDEEEKEKEKKDEE